MPGTATGSSALTANALNINNGTTGTHTDHLTTAKTFIRSQTRNPTQSPMHLCAQRS